MTGHFSAPLEHNLASVRKICERDHNWGRVGLAAFSLWRTSFGPTYWKRDKMGTRLGEVVRSVVAWCCTDSEWCLCGDHLLRHHRNYVADNATALRHTPSTSLYQHIFLHRSGVMECRSVWTMTTFMVTYLGDGAKPKQKASDLHVRCTKLKWKSGTWKSLNPEPVEKGKWAHKIQTIWVTPKNHAATQAKLQSTRKNKKGYPKRGFKDWYMALMNWLTTAISGKMQEMVVF